MKTLLIKNRMVFTIEDTVYGYFTLKLLIEKHREFNLGTHLAFIDFKKAFDKVNSNKLLWILADDAVSQQLLKNIHNIYKMTSLAVRTNNRLRMVGDL